MFKKKAWYMGTIIIGILLFGGSFLLKGEDQKHIMGLLLGVGSGLVGMSIANLYMIYLEQKNPALVKKNTIEYNDERNITIRHKAKAKAGDITQWLIIGISYITILTNAPVWVTLTAVGIFLIYNILGVYFTSKYGKSM
ncbi:hypothetical protein EDC18_11030 [Natranaerovirga pectinivora]|uniref:DUF2178 domain-containing protein n=1 Tax=Natranaerovirga pectinivora TaxID=682400 RepID=A0A4R3MI53_9FIRM|nr:hypothetical protein [Natranaerovirga pectinivora]TCT12956.1 hypothetical protein EDC18_11030 [Natranaerovirga pectinivora]